MRWWMFLIPWFPYQNSASGWESAGVVSITDHAVFRRWIKVLCNLWIGCTWKTLHAECATNFVKWVFELDAITRGP